MKRERKLQIFGILLFAFGLMYIISLLGHTGADDARITSDEAIYGNPFTLPYDNIGGMMGAYLGYLSFFLIGGSAYFFALFIIIAAGRIMSIDICRRLFKHGAMIFVLSFLFFMLIDIHRVYPDVYFMEKSLLSGAIGESVIVMLKKLVGTAGSYILVFTAIASAMVIYATISHRVRNGLVLAGTKIREAADEMWKRRDEVLEPARKIAERARRKGKILDPEAEDEAVRNTVNSTVSNNAFREDPINSESPDVIFPRELREERNSTRPGARRVVLRNKKRNVGDDNEEDFVPPDIDLLNSVESRGPIYDEKELAQTGQLLRETLETFGVRLSGQIEMLPGPVITRFEIRPAAGIKVNQIVNLADDLALSLRAKSIRIVAPIPGKGAVGVEIPNRSPQLVYLREIIESERFEHSTAALPLALGKDISGKSFVADLASMPHLLIAGTTGSGKSVCINGIVTSLMFALHPDQIRFIFIDPKMLELSIYKGIPYLEGKVVTNPKRAEKVLSDVVTEMEERYKKLASAAVRSIVDYNKKQRKSEDRLPYIIIVVDELADLMMSAQSSRVELLITRLAQMARAVGIHLILATQRPSVDVITGLIKANFPSRIAFQVATKIDSRTILDGNGAEKLLGRGDMLFLEAGLPEPIRIHGAFVASEETERLVEFLRDQNFTKAREETKPDEIDENSPEAKALDDPVLLEAIETVIMQGQASVSLLQRKLGIGYQRAARLIDDLEDMKVIGSYNESKARDVLVDKGFLDTIKSRKFH